MNLKKMEEDNIAIQREKNQLKNLPSRILQNYILKKQKDYKT